jgi:signal transduction histidine kinase
MIANINRLDDIAKRAVSVRRYEIDRGKLHLEKVRLGDVLYAAIDDQQEFADKNRCEIQVEISLGEDAALRIDFALMRISFVCLLNNAIKYSIPPLPDKLKIVKIRTGTILDDVYVEFENFGLGILKSDYDRVFEEGERSVPPTGEFAHVGGEGLGLFDARKIVVAHRGSIKIHSYHQYGKHVTPENILRCVTRFKVRIPKEK